MLGVQNWKFIHAGSQDSRVGFATEGGGAWPVWDRYLTIDGKRAYHLGNVCQTCAFFFERLGGANTAVQIENTANALRAGVNELSDPAIEQISMGLPEGDYIVSLSRLEPHLILPGQKDDYFVKEQIALYGTDPFYNLPHNPHVPYHRVGNVDLGDHAQLLNFVIPMFPESWLTEKTISDYVQLLEAGKMPTAVSVSLLDIKGPADWEGDLSITEHWSFAHYLLDGHHKLAAARRCGRSINLLSFTAIKHGISTLEEVKKALDASAVLG